MPLSVNLKKKDPRFKGDKPSFKVTVSGPRELFTAKVQRFLILHGLDLYVDEDGFSVWMTRGTIGPPPVYLGALLTSKYGARHKPDMRDFLRMAASEVEPEDTLAGLLGGSPEILPGAQRLRVQAGKDVFIANCDVDNTARRQLLEGAGWLPVPDPSKRLEDGFGTRPYVTRDPFVAANLEGYMNDAAARTMRNKLADAMKAMTSARSHEPYENFSVPAPAGLSYLPFQARSVQDILERNKSAIIADDMGLGKTIQALGVLNGKPDTKTMLVVCQANMRLKWVAEIEKWKVNRDLTVGHAEGNNYPDTDIVVINYDIVARHEERIRSTKWDIIVKDEAHNQKNLEAKRTLALMGDLLDESGGNPLPLSDDGLVLEMTGTPKPNRVSELWPLLTSTRPDIWGRGPEARQIFINRYEPPFLIKRSVGKGPRAREIIIPLPGKPMREEELNLRMFGSGSMIRRLKRDTNLPPKMRSSIPIPIKLTKEDREMLKEAEAVIGKIGRSSGQEVNITDPKSAGAIIDVVQGLSPQSPEFQEIARVRRNLGLVKAPHAARFIIDELAEEDGMFEGNRSKTVVFAHHKEVIRIIAEMAREKYPDGVCVYDGSMSPKAKQKAVDDFQENPEKRIFIMSLSGATGITLTAANRLRSVEMDWSPSNVSQIEDRIWRIGQMASCHIGYLFIPDSLDVAIGNTIVTKMESDERTLNKPYFSLRMDPDKTAEPPGMPDFDKGPAPGRQDGGKADDASEKQKTVRRKETPQAEMDI